MSESQKVVLVIGAGDATGGAIAKRFAREGYIACVTRRSADKLKPLVDEIIADGGQAHGFASDARKEEEVAELVETIERDIGPIEAFVFNIGANVPCSVLDETARKYFKTQLCLLRKRIEGSGVRIEAAGYQRGFKLVLEHPPIRLNQPDRKAAAPANESGAFAGRPNVSIWSANALG